MTLRTRLKLCVAAILLMISLGTFVGLKIQSGAEKWRLVGQGELITKGSEPLAKPGYGERDWVLGTVRYTDGGETKNVTRLVYWSRELGTFHPIWVEDATGSIFVEGIDWSSSSGPKPNSWISFAFTGFLLGIVLAMLIFSFTSPRKRTRPVQSLSS